MLILAGVYRAFVGLTAFLVVSTLLKGDLPPDGIYRWFATVGAGMVFVESIYRLSRMLRSRHPAARRHYDERA